MSQRKSMQPEEAKDSKEQTLEEAKQQFEAAHEKGMKSFQAPTIEQHLQQLAKRLMKRHRRLRNTRSCLRVNRSHSLKNNQPLCCVLDPLCIDDNQRGR